MATPEYQRSLENEIERIGQDRAALVLAFIAWQTEALNTLGKMLDAFPNDRAG